MKTFSGQCFFKQCVENVLCRAQAQESRGRLYKINEKKAGNRGVTLMSEFEIKFLNIVIFS